MDLGFRASCPSCALSTAMLKEFEEKIQNLLRLPRFYYPQIPECGNPWNIMSITVLDEVTGL